MAFNIDAFHDSESAGRQDDIVIAVMGVTGTGKSSFVKILTGDPSVHIGDSLESETSDVQIYRFLDRTSGCNVAIVDTPGFDDSRATVTDTDVLRKITKFLLAEYDKDRKLNGLIYLQRISDPKFSGQSGRNLRMFRNLCGAENFKNVVVLTTFWDCVSDQGEAVKREEQMKSVFFKELFNGGAHFMRHDRTIKSAQKVLRHILTLVPTNVQIQEEMRLEKKPLEDTAAGSVQREELERMISKHNAEVEELRVELAAIKTSNAEARRQLEEDRAHLQAVLAQWETEISELKRGMDHERESRERMEEQATIQREKYERKEREWSDWSTQVNARDESLQAQLDREKKLREEAHREAEKREAEKEAYVRAVEARVKEAQRKEAIRLKAALDHDAESNKSYALRGVELAEEIPFVPNFIAKPAFGVLGFVLDLIVS